MFNPISYLLIFLYLCLSIYENRLYFFIKNVDDLRLVITNERDSSIKRSLKINRYWNLISWGLIIAIILLNDRWSFLAADALVLGEALMVINLRNTKRQL